MQWLIYSQISERRRAFGVLGVAENQYYGGAVRQTSPSIPIRLSAIFYEVTNERHSVRAASRFSLNVLRFESDLCELNRL